MRLENVVQLYVLEEEENMGAGGNQSLDVWVIDFGSKCTANYS